MPRENGAQHCREASQGDIHAPGAWEIKASQPHKHDQEVSPLQRSRQTASPQELPNESVAMVLNSGARPADTWLSDPGLSVPLAAPAARQSSSGLGAGWLKNRREICIQDWLQAGPVITPGSYQGVTGPSQGKQGGPNLHYSFPGSCGQLDSSLSLHGSWSWSGGSDVQI